MEINQINEFDVQMTEAIHQWFIGIILNPIFILGIVLNVLILYVFFRPRHHRSTSHVYLSYLALADLVYLLFMLEYTVESWGISRFENLSNEACSIIFFLRGVFGTWSALLLVSFSFNRLLYCQTALNLIRKMTCTTTNLASTSSNVDTHSAQDTIPQSNNDITASNSLITQNQSGENVEFMRSIECLEANTNNPQDVFRMEFLSWLRRISHAIAKPFFFILICFVVAVLVTLPRLFSFKLSEEHHHVTCRSSKDAGVSLILHMIFHIVFQRLGSTSVVLIINIVLYYKLKLFLNYMNRLGRSEQRNTSPAMSFTTMTSEDSILASEFALVRASIVMAVIVVILFLPPGVHWSFIYYYDLNHNKTTSEQHFINMHSLIGDLEAVTATLNHVLNFVVYYFTVPYFRKQVQRLRSRWWRDMSQILRNKILTVKKSTSDFDQESTLMLIRSPLSQSKSVQSPHSTSAKEETHVTSV